MSNIADDAAKTVTDETELRGPYEEALKTLEQTRATLASLLARSDEMSRLLVEVARIGKVFESVANDLVDATFSMSAAATSAVPARATLVTLVEELGRLARISLIAGGDVRRELLNHEDGRASTVRSIRESDVALQELAITIKRFVADAARAPRAPKIVVASARSVPAETSNPFAWRALNAPKPGGGLKN